MSMKQWESSMGVRAQDSQITNQTLYPVHHSLHLTHTLLLAHGMALLINCFSLTLFGNKYNFFF